MTTQARERPARRRGAPDPRLVIGLLLVAASIAGVLVLVGAAGASVQVYAARSALAPGDEVDAEDLVLVDAGLDVGADLYLTADALPEGGVVVTRPVGEGELVPASAVGRASGTRLAAIVVTVDGTLSRAVEPGSTVDVWSAAEVEGGRYGPPAVLVSGADVVRLVEAEGIVVDEGAVSVEVLVPRTKLARVIEALANGDAISLVPVALPVGG